MYKIIKGYNYSEDALDSAIVIDTAIEVAKKLSVSMNRLVSVLDCNVHTEMRVRGWALHGSWKWVLPCKLCTGSGLQGPYGNYCPKCSGIGYVEDRL